MMLIGPLGSRGDVAWESGRGHYLRQQRIRVKRDARYQLLQLLRRKGRGRPLLLRWILLRRVLLRGILLRWILLRWICRGRALLLLWILLGRILLRGIRWGLALLLLLRILLLRVLLLW